MVGGWVIAEDGKVGPFRPNPYYLPSAPDRPSDPIDALLRLTATGQQRTEELIAAVRDAVVEIGLDEQHRPLVGRAPDGAKCIVVVTAEVQKRGTDIENWYAIPGSDLGGLLPEGIDVMINPAGKVPFRLFRAGLAEADDHQDVDNER
jgi:hypothetical protein